MTSPASRLRDLILERRPVIGTFISTPSAEIVEMLGLAGFDFGVIDLEHGYFGTESIADMLRAAELRGLAALVRVPQESGEQVGKSLDLGAAGIVVPGIRSLDDARRMLALMRYPPHGVRGAHLSTRHLRYSVDGFGAHAADPLQRPFTVLQIEAALPSADIDAIASLPGLDVLFIGINDLANSLGLPGMFEHPKVQAVVETIIECGQRHGVGLGLWIREPAGAARVAARGFQFIAISNNELLFFEAAKGLAEAARTSLAQFKE